MPDSHYSVAALLCLPRLLCTLYPGITALVSDVVESRVRTVSPVVELTSVIL